MAVGVLDCVVCHEGEADFGFVGFLLEGGGLAISTSIFIFRKHVLGRHRRAGNAQLELDFDTFLARLRF